MEKIDSEYLSNEDVEKIKQLVDEKKIQAILDIFDAFINHLYSEMPDCDSCDDRRGDPAINEGYY